VTLFDPNSKPRGFCSGDDRSEMLDLVPAQSRVKVACRPRYGCRTSDGVVVQAPAPHG
jgi:transposase